MTSWYNIVVAWSSFLNAGKEFKMGKNLKGKEICKGICQRKDGLFVARLVEKSGKRHARIFKTIPEARNWLENTRQADKTGIHGSPHGAGNGAAHEQPGVHQLADGRACEKQLV